MQSMKYFFATILFFWVTVLADFEVDLEKVVVIHQCDPYCTFNYSEITSKTIEFFPKNCDYVCGLIVLNENTDLTASQLRTYFGNMTKLFGGIRVENTPFEGLSIFRGRNKTTNRFDFYCEVFGLSISNNKNLKNIDLLSKVNFIRDKKTNECQLEFENNPKLDASHLCQDEHYKDMYGLRITGNLKNCGCRGDLITMETNNSFGNCTTFNGGLHLSQITDPNMSSLSKIMKIRGDVEIQMTRFQNLSFLKKLKRVEVKHGYMNEEVVMNIHDNYEMTRFGPLPYLQLMYDVMGGLFIMNLENLHPDFCLTYQEMQFFLRGLVSFKNIHASFCPGGMNEYCDFRTMKSLGDNCYYIYGNIVIESGDEKYLYKLKGMEILFGTLTIKNSKLESLNFLENLNYIGNLEDDEYVIEIISNKNLTSAELPRLKNIISKGGRTVVIHDNPLLVTDGCIIFPLSYQTNVEFIGDNCENGSRISQRSFFVLFVIYHSSRHTVFEFI